MKFFKVALICACFVGLTPSVWGQEASPKPNGAPAGVIGYVDPLSGNFKPLAQGSTLDPEALAVIVPITGKLVFNFTITIASTIATTSPIACTGTAEVIDASSNFILESASVAASRSGATATCTVSIPYSWSLTTASTDKVILNISVTAGSLASGSAGLPNRSHSQGLGQISVPAPGVTTTETVKVTI
jgi:hypothetical protein